MTRHRLEVADVFRSYGLEFLAKYGDSISSGQRRVLKAVAQCRTAALGGHVEKCDQCGHQQIAYNSCRNRHCPKCQAAARARWMEERAAELLPVPYFHVVFTLPEAFGPLALQNPRVVYGTLFRATAKTLLQVAAASSTSLATPCAASNSHQPAPVCGFVQRIISDVPAALCIRRYVHFWHLRYNPLRYEMPLRMARRKS